MFRALMIEDVGSRRDEFLLLEMQGRGQELDGRPGTELVDALDPLVDQNLSGDDDQDSELDSSHDREGGDALPESGEGRDDEGPSRAV